VVAAGGTGNRIAARLGRLITGIDCLPDLTPLDVVFRAIADSDMIFIVSGLEDDAVAGRAAEIAALARGSGACKILVALGTNPLWHEPMKRWRVIRLCMPRWMCFSWFLTTV